jgi:hypothetical protein
MILPPQTMPNAATTLHGLHYSLHCPGLPHQFASEAAKARTKSHQLKAAQQAKHYWLGLHSSPLRAHSAVSPPPLTVPHNAAAGRITLLMMMAPAKDD